MRHSAAMAAMVCTILWTQIAVQAQTPAEALQKLGAKVREVDGKIVELSVEAQKFGEDEYRLIGRCADLKKIMIRGNTLNDRTLPLLAGLTELEEFSSDGSGFTDDGYRHFAPFKKLRVLNLWHPSWSSNEFTGSGLAHLKDLPKLERLTFAGSTAGDAAMEAVGQITQLKEFHTWHTMQTQAGNEHLVKLENLTVLKMGQRLPRPPNVAPSFDGSSIKVFSRMKSLQKLDLTEAILTADDLMPLKDLPKLTTVTIRQCDISADDVRKLREALPNVKIEHTPITDLDREELLRKKLRLDLPGGAAPATSPAPKQ